MSDEELIKETMMLDYSQLVMHNVYMIKENKRLNNIINEAIKRSDELANEIEDLEGSYSYMFIEIINILKGGNK